MPQKILDFVLKRYEAADFPACFEQYENWSASKPLEGLKILDASPVYQNSLVKYLPLVAGGARLFVSRRSGVLRDEGFIGRIPEFGIGLADGIGGGYDAILDCAAAHIDLDARLGVVELTRTGARHYAKTGKKVFLADESEVKKLETVLGTGDGFARAMKELGHGDFCGENVMLFGFGKVGRGIAAAAQRMGAQVCAVDDREKVRVPEGVCLVDLNDMAKISSNAADAWCIVAATGIKNALCGKLDAKRICAGKTLLANMGVEDEFGPEFPDARVLNHKKPLNFILEEPTHVRYIDPTFALSNVGILELMKNGRASGIIRPSIKLQNGILETVFKNGKIQTEVRSTGILFF